MRAITVVKAKRFQAISQLFQATDAQLDLQAVCSALNASGTVTKSTLKEYYQANPATIGRVIGVYPNAETVIAAAELKCGVVTEKNLVEINLQCKHIIDAITRPKHEQFLQEGLANYLEAGDGDVRVPFAALTDFLYEEYVDFVHEADNGLVSIAGSLNEKILIKALDNAGFAEGKDYKKTGKDAEADLQIEHHGRVTVILYCEIKSYAARERLLRGLKDIQQPSKIGIGFFNNAGEFNPDRTQTLLQAMPWAIYMPDTTLEKVAIESKRQRTSKQDGLYRPLSQFVTDMSVFRDTGALPVYQPSA